MNVRQKASLIFALLAIVFATGCSRESQTPPSSGPGAEYVFQGIWTATGTRDTVSLGSDRRASIASFTGSLVLSGSSRPNVGFRAEAIVFNDSSTGGTGRSVWTDQRGDHVFSELRGDASD